MATKVLTRLVDDTDGSDAAETVQFSLDGQTFEIDLSVDNAAKLRDALAPYIERLPRMRARGGKSSVDSTPKSSIATLSACGPRRTGLRSASRAVSPLTSSADTRLPVTDALACRPARAPSKSNARIIRCY